MEASTLPLWAQILGLIVGPLLTYLGITYKERSNLKKIADDSVAKTIETQDKKFDKLDSKLDKTEAEYQALKVKVDKLHKAYRRIMNALGVIESQADSIRVRLATYLDLIEVAPDKASSQLHAVFTGFDDLFDTIRELHEHSDPIEEQPKRARRDSVPLVSDSTADLKHQLEDLSAQDKDKPP